MLPATREITEVLLRRSHVGGVSFFGGIEHAEMNASSPAANAGLPTATPALAHPFQRVLLLAPRPFIKGLFLRRRLAKVLETVIAKAPIFMVDGHLGPTACHIKPSEAVSSVADLSDLDAQIFTVVCPCDVTRFVAAAISGKRLPSEYPRHRIVIEDFAQAFRSQLDRVLWHICALPQRCLAGEAS